MAIPKEVMDGLKRVTELTPKTPRPDYLNDYEEIAKMLMSIDPCYVALVGMLTSLYKKAFLNPSLRRELIDGLTFLADRFGIETEKKQVD